MREIKKIETRIIVVVVVIVVVVAVVVVVSIIISVLVWKRILKGAEFLGHYGDTKLYRKYGGPSLTRAAVDFNRMKVQNIKGNVG